MRKKAVQLMLGLGMSLALMGTTVPCFAAEETAAESETEAVEEATAEESGRLHNVTKQQIITLFSHGNSVESISEQLNVPVSTVQLVIDNYFEADAN